jgi:hypothetical protein
MALMSTKVPWTKTCAPPQLGMMVGHHEPSKLVEPALFYLKNKHLKTHFSWKCYITSF